MNKRVWFRVVGGVSLLIGLLLILTGSYFYSLAGKSLYYKYGKSHWQTAHPAECTDYRKDYFEPLGKQQKLDYSCEAARQLPSTSYKVKTSDGLDIHYLIYPTPLKQSNTPLLLHIPGITSDWLNGARYVKASERMGFQLVVMEMRNHGNSSINGKGVRYGCAEHQDIIAVTEALHQRYPQRAIMLWSSSGATMAVSNAAEQLSKSPWVEAIVLENPISSLYDVAQVKSPGLPAFVYKGFLTAASWRAGEDFKTCAPTQKIKDITQPILITVSKNDHLTPVWMAKKVYKHIHSTKKLKFMIMAFMSGFGMDNRKYMRRIC